MRVLSESDAKGQVHYPILHVESFCPFSRRAFLSAHELEIDVTLDQAPVGTPPEHWQDLDPAGCPPILEIGPGVIISGATPICEYFEESLFTEDIGGRYQAAPMVRDPRPLRLFPGSARNRAEIRRFVQWFDEKFALEVSLPYLQEKYRRRFYARYTQSSELFEAVAPDTAVIRNCIASLRLHLDYFESLLDEGGRDWFAGESFSMADLAAASHFSCLDYVGMIQWGNRRLKDWYLRVKCRPSFRFLLDERIPGLAPGRFYTALDF